MMETLRLPLKMNFYQHKPTDYRKIKELADREIFIDLEGK